MKFLKFDPENRNRVISRLFDAGYIETGSIWAEHGLDIKFKPHGTAQMRVFAKLLATFDKNDDSADQSALRFLGCMTIIDLDLKMVEFSIMEFFAFVMLVRDYAKKYPERRKGR